MLQVYGQRFWRFARQRPRTSRQVQQSPPRRGGILESPHPSREHRVRAQRLATSRHVIVIELDRSIETAPGIGEQPAALVETTEAQRLARGSRARRALA